MSAHHHFRPKKVATSAPLQFNINGPPDEERRLAYVALTRGMGWVSITHAEYRCGFTRPSPFIDDIPAENRVAGWLHGKPKPSSRNNGALLRGEAELDALELLRRF